MRPRTLTAAATPLLIALAGSGTASAGSATERFSLVTTTTHGKPVYSVIATGDFTDGGTAGQPNRGSVTLRLANGTITLRVTKGRRSVAKTTTATACQQTQTSSGSYTIVGGTGMYSGITGSGRSTTHATFVEQRAGGVCSARFAAAQVVIAVTGSVALP